MTASKFKITSPDKIIYPNQNIKKIDVINYYISVAEFMLPYVKGRLLSVIRCHGGVGGETFFKKHANSDKFIEVFNLKGDDYFYVKNQTQLAYQAQLGTIEFHTWGATAKKINYPDVMVLDLDPDEEMPLKNLQNAVLKVKSVLDEVGLKSFLKTSGGKGYHILVPFKKTKGWQSFYDFSKTVAQIAESKWPNEFTTNIRKSQRKGKIFVDYLRNNYASTCVAPYSLRAKDGAPISMPISWDDLFDIAPSKINFENYKQYMGKSWKDFFNTNQQLK